MLGVVYSIPLGQESSSIKADDVTTLQKRYLSCQLTWLHQCCCCFMCYWQSIVTLLCHGLALVVSCCTC